MTDIEIGQVLSLKIRYNNEGKVAEKKHPYLVVDIHEEFNTIEIAQIDSLEGKEFKAAKKSNKTIYYDYPVEKVIDKDSYIQLDNTILIEQYEKLSFYRRQIDKLSPEKLSETLSAYKEYHKKNIILENKQVYMTRDELETLNN